VNQAKGSDVSNELLQQSSRPCVIEDSHIVNEVFFCVTNPELIDTLTELTFWCAPLEA
jgi:hypothetical protein